MPVNEHGMKTEMRRFIAAATVKNNGIGHPQIGRRHLLSGAAMSAGIGCYYVAKATPNRQEVHWHYNIAVISRDERNAWRGNSVNISGKWLCMMRGDLPERRSTL